MSKGTKFLIIVGDGMAGWPVDQFDGKSTLEAADIPVMDELSRNGETGLLKTIPDGMPPGSDVGHFSLLGYDPRACLTGRAPLEAASLGLTQKSNETAFRCNTITIENGKIIDHSAGHITTAESAKLIEAVQKNLGTDGIKFYPGASYRHIMMTDTDYSGLACVPPHDHLGEDYRDFLPKGKNAEILVDLIERSAPVLNDHPVNRKRLADGKRPANLIWLWGQGTLPNLRTFQEKYGLSGAAVSAVDLVKGIGRITGLDILDVPGITGWIDTNYVGKAEAALESLEEHDFALIHVEAPDEAGHQGDPPTKKKAIEDFDRLVIGTIKKNLGKFERVRIMILPDHRTPEAIRTHSPEPVPYILYDSCSGKIKPSDRTYSEKAAEETGILIENGPDLIEKLFKEL